MKSLTALRRAKFLTQAQLAAELDVSPSSVTAWEHAGRGANLSLANQKKITTYFGVEPADLWTEPNGAVDPAKADA